MKYSNKIALASLLFANCSAFASTPAEGWYWGLLGGASYTSSIRGPGPDPLPLITLNTLVNPNPTFPLVFNGINTYVIHLSNNLFPGFGLGTQGTLNYGVGGDFAAHVGYRICNFRVEGELLFNYSPLSKIQLGGLSISKHVTLVNPIRLSGQTWMGAGLINGYYDFFDEEYETTWAPYIGLGIGFGYARNTETYTVPYLFSREFHTDFTSSNGTPVGQAILGIHYFYSDDLSLGLDYRYLTTRTIARFNSRLQTHTVNLHFNYSFAD